MSGGISARMAAMLLVAVLAIIARVGAVARPPPLGRRAVISTAAAGVAGLTIPARTALAAPQTNPVLVLGAGGGTGRACVEALLARRIPCIASTRSGRLELPNAAAYDASSLRLAAVDVTSPLTLEALLAKQSLSGVIFAASASAKGGDAVAVDRDGVITAARQCIAAGVPRLCIVSSGAVTRPDSAVYQLLNLVGSGIMAAKIEGEDEVRRLYASPEVVSRGVGYTIIRPGGLTPAFAEDGAWLGKGVAALELNQGDGVSGRISRADVASLCVESLFSQAAFDTTFECYEADTAKPIESVGISNILGQRSPTKVKTGKEQRSGTGEWPGIFEGLRPDMAAAAAAVIRS